MEVPFPRSILWIAWRHGERDRESQSSRSEQRGGLTAVRNVQPVGGQIAYSAHSPYRYQINTTPTWRAYASQLIDKTRRDESRIQDRRHRRAHADPCRCVRRPHPRGMVQTLSL